MSEVVHIPTDTMLPVNRTLLIREWWWTYLHVLKGNRTMTELNGLTAELEERGIVVAGQSMPFDGAEELRRDVQYMVKR